MRDIKFRGKSKLTGKWVYGNYDFYIFIETNLLENIIENKNELPIPIDIKTLGEYTGLKDKNGKEIYEGDIVKCSFYPEFVFEIKFTELCWYMRKIPTSEHIKLSDVLYEDLEVIGNIYDNPELLEEEKGE